MTHTPGPWIDSPNASDAIISTDPDAMADAGIEVEYYGGAVICESVARQNKPLIKAAPEMLEACEAATKYDNAIRLCADDPDKMSSYCTAEGEDLDRLYLDWITKARNAIAKVRGRSPKKES